MFGLQALINMGVNVGLLPAKGITLPFVSSGGSSMLAVSITLGMLLALTRRRPDVARLKKPPLLPTSSACKPTGPVRSDANKRASVLLAAGGTGGHLFPAQALAEELARRAIAVDLATDMRGDRYGTGFPARKVYRLPSATLAGKSPVAMARTACCCRAGSSAAFTLLGQASSRDVVVGFGGYPTFPPLKAARLRGIPTVLHEQNAVLGRANRMLAKGVTRIATSFEATKFLGARAASTRSRLTGNPVRSAVIEAAQRPYWRARADGPLSAAGVRRQPGRALLLRGGAARAGAAADGDPRPPAGRAAGARRGRRGVSRGLSRQRHRGRGGALLRATCPSAWRNPSSSSPAPAPRRSPS